MSLYQLSVIDLINECGSVSIIDDDTCVCGRKPNGSTVYLSNCVRALRDLVVRGKVRNNSGSFTVVK